MSESWLIQLFGFSYRVRRRAWGDGGHDAVNCGYRVVIKTYFFIPAPCWSSAQ